MKEIPLGVGEKALIDDESLPLVSQFKWMCLQMPDGTKYAGTLIKMNGIEQVLLMHDLIMYPDMLGDGKYEKLEVDQEAIHLYEPADG